MNKYVLDRLLLICCMVFIVACKKEKTRICQLYSGDVGYAVGLIESSVTTKSVYTDYTYSFNVGNVDYKGHEMVYGIRQTPKSFVTKKYVVVYSVDNPANSDLNRNYLLNTEADFEDFLVKYKTGPPAPDFPEKCK